MQNQRKRREITFDTHATITYVGPGLVTGMTAANILRNNCSLCVDPCEYRYSQLFISVKRL